MSRCVPVTFAPSGATVWVDPGTSVLEAARNAGVVVPAPCGGRGVCGACGVRVEAGDLAAPGPDEVAGLTRAPSGVRLACKAVIAGAVTLRPVATLPEGALAGEPRCADRIFAAVDLGTTGVSAVALDASSGREIGRATVPNRQQTWGADVLSRVSAAIGGAAFELRRAAEASIEEAVGYACTGCTDRVERLVISGNTAMSALLCGSDVRSLASSPFDPPVGGDVLPQDAALRSVLADGAQVFVVPPLAGFVGGDALAGAISTGMFESAGPSMLVDVGTNAEIVLAIRGELWVASAAAGPAFDGGGVSCGGPAVDRAVVRVGLVGDRVEVETIGGGDPLWFSGAGLMSALALLVRTGHVSADGLLLSEGPLKERYGIDSSGVVTVDFSSGAGGLVLTQRDVRELQLAKAAVRTGIVHVLRAAGMRPESLESVFVAGAFGAALPAEDLVTLGVVPAEAQAVVRHVGNSSLEGAATIAMDPQILHSTRAAARAHHVDLAGDPEFQATLMGALELAPFSAGDWL